jgi:hypothetical protein
MLEALAGLLAAVVVVGLIVWRRRPSAILVAAEPDVALLSSAAALRRLGARITRYDSEAGTLEAEVAPAAVVRVRAAVEHEGTTRVHLEGDAATRGIIRRFRGALSA